MIPGSNILDMAFRVIATSGVQYYQYVSRSINSVGLWESVYALPIKIWGSFQPVERRLYAELGLDLNKKYAHLFVPNNVLDVNRDVSGDQMIFQGEKYQCESSEPWYGLDGWTDILMVKVPST